MKAIFQINIGEEKIFEPCLKSVEWYAKKIGAKHIVSTKRKINFPNVWYEKLQFLELFKQGYSQILCLDADVIITPNAENIFEKYPNSDTFYAYHENDYRHWMNRDCDIDCFECDFVWPIEANGKRRYFNAGVMLAGSDSHNFFYKTNPQLTVHGTPCYSDQVYFNYLLSSSDTKFESLDYSFNRMDLGLADETNERRKSNFIHYAGNGYGNKSQTIEKDYSFFYYNKT